mmetsp:Transcript_11811/g.27736  ORF Transcript_11811/g.27736 Transcript_11811/m.27736 type:complete len:114 (+) Transcript_11811:214-555(+)
MTTPSTDRLRAADGWMGEAPARSSGRLQDEVDAGLERNMSSPGDLGRDQRGGPGALGPGDSAGARITALRTSGRRKTNPIHSAGRVISKVKDDSGRDWGTSLDEWEQRWGVPP